ncbi:hypothetical protein ACFX13_001267 [Malus domestica]
MADDGSTPAVSVHLACLILVLLCKLDMKADIYKDVSLSYLFLANNLHFIVENVQQTPNLKLLVGEDWVTEHANKVKLYASNYESTTRTKVLSSLPEKSSEISPEMAKECFKRFNARLKKQTSWAVEDGKLRELLEDVNCTVYNLYDSFIFHSVPSDRFRSFRSFQFKPNDHIQRCIHLNAKAIL